MTVDAVALNRLVDAELGKLGDQRVERYIRDFLVEPRPENRDWDYGEPGQQYVCWTVLQHPPSNIEVAYCENGFGPQAPWGMLFLTGEFISMGMDSQWYPTFLQTFFASRAASHLPIWRVFKTDKSGVREAITDEDAWDDTWRAVNAFRKVDPTVQYDCDTSIEYERE